MKNTVLGRKLVFGDPEQIQALRMLEKSDGVKDIEFSTWKEYREVVQTVRFECVLFECVVCSKERRFSFEVGTEVEWEGNCHACGTKYRYDINEEVLSIAQ